jgi:hypothetical protein
MTPGQLAPCFTLAFVVAGFAAAVAVAGASLTGDDAALESILVGLPPLEEGVGGVKLGLGWYMYFFPPRETNPPSNAHKASVASRADLSSILARPKQAVSLSQSISWAGCQVGRRDRAGGQ